MKYVDNEFHLILLSLFLPDDYHLLVIKMLEPRYGGVTMSQLQHFGGLQREVGSFPSFSVSLAGFCDGKQQMGTRLHPDRIIPEERRRQ